MQFADGYCKRDLLNTLLDLKTQGNGYWYDLFISKGTINSIKPSKGKKKKNNKLHKRFCVIGNENWMVYTIVCSPHPDFRGCGGAKIMFFPLNKKHRRKFVLVSTNVWTNGILPFELRRFLKTTLWSPELIGFNKTLPENISWRNNLTLDRDLTLYDYTKGEPYVYNHISLKKREMIIKTLIGKDLSKIVMAYIGIANKNDNTMKELLKINYY